MNRAILRLALPNILANLTIPLIGLTDEYLMGNYAYTYHFGAVVIGVTAFNLLYWNLNFLRMGTSGFTAQAYGANDVPEIVYSLLRALVVGLFISLPLLLFSTPLIKLCFNIIHPQEKIRVLAESYMYIRIWALPAGLSIFVIQGWFIGRQNTIIPMFISILTQILNISFCFYCVLELNLSSDGVAYSAVLAQYISMIAYIIAVFFYKPLFKKVKINIQKVFEVEKLKQFFSVNGNIFLRTFVNTFTLSFFKLNNKVVTSTHLLDANEIIFQFMLVFSFFIDGFAFAGEALVGRFIGASNLKALKKTVKLLFVWGSGIAILFFILYYMIADDAIRMINKNIGVQEVASEYIWWAIFFPIVCFAAFIWDGIYIGATAARTMRNSMLIASVAFFACYFMLPEHWGNHVLLFALTLYFIIRGIVQTLFYRKAVLRRIVV